MSARFVLCLCGAIALSSVARADTFDVGPGKRYSALSQVAGTLAPGDVVQIHGGATYTEDVTIDVSGTPSAKITVRGLAVNGQRPVLSGSLHIDGDHIVLESLDIRDGDPVCLRHGGNDLTVLDTAVHDCPSHGILGTDQGSGSLTLERVEVYNCATVQTGNRKHQVYIATDEVAHPGSVFRMQLSYLHDCGSGGSNIKSRAERTELYSNWIENGGLYEAELYGPDEDGVPTGWTEDLAREDADVVGNVFYRTHNQDTSFLFRIGGDGAPELGDAGLNDTKGRARFAYNTVIAPRGTGVFRTFNRVDSVEAHNNVLFAEGGLRVLADEAQWVGGRQLFTGARNWVSDGSTDMPSGWTDTVYGSDPQLADRAARDLYPLAGSALVDAALSPTVSPPGHELPQPLQVPFYHPPPANVLAASITRPTVGVIDIGAFEYGTPPPTSSAASGGGSSADPDRERDSTKTSCGCHAVRPVPGAGIVLLLALLVLSRRVWS